MRIERFILACVIGLASCGIMLISQASGSAVFGLIGALGALFTAVYMHYEGSR